MSYKYALFDLDGTIADTTEGVIYSAREIVKKLGLRTLTPEEELSLIGPPLQKSFVDIYNMSQEDAQKTADGFRIYYSDKGLFMAKLYDGIIPLAEKLTSIGVKIAVATYKREDYARRLMNYFGFDKYAGIIYGADNMNRLTKADIIEKCVCDFRPENRREVVMIGDTAHDSKGAGQSGVDFIGVTYGFGFKTADDVISAGGIGAADSPMEIMRYFL